MSTRAFHRILKLARTTESFSIAFPSLPDNAWRTQQ